MNLKEFRESTDRNIYWRLQEGERQNLLDEAIEIIEDYESNQVEAQVKPANGGLDYDFIVRVMLSMTEYPDLLPENIRIEKAKLSERYRELYDKKEPHILARIEWLKNYIESRLSV